MNKTYADMTTVEIRQDSRRHWKGVIESKGIDRVIDAYQDAIFRVNPPGYVEGIRDAMIEAGDH